MRACVHACMCVGIWTFHVATLGGRRPEMDSLFVCRNFVHESHKLVSE